MSQDLKFRCYCFSLDIIKFLRNNKWDKLSFVIVHQLMRSVLSIGANVIEAKNSSSRQEFRRYYEIALKSSGESKYWMCLLRDGFDVKDEVLINLLKEADELSKILASAVIKLKRAN